jgi:hypothetical protein
MSKNLKKKRCLKEDDMKKDGDKEDSNEKDVLLQEIWKRFKAYHKDGGHDDNDHIFVGDCKLCSGPCIYDFSSADQFQNCVPCGECNDLYCNACAGGDKYWEVFKDVHVSSSFWPIRQCLEPNNCQLCVENVTTVNYCEQCFSCINF